MRKRFSSVAAVVLLLIGRPAAAESTAVDAALGFFNQGGAYCFRLAPEGVAMADETTWTIMVLTSARNTKKTFKIREIDPGRLRLRGAALQAMGDIVTGVWRVDRDRTEFFERFGQGIRAGRLRARVTRIHLTHLEDPLSEARRAELYLRFSERGSRVSFAEAPDLSAEEFAEYAGYFPD